MEAMKTETQAETFVVEEGELPVVFSTSPDSPAAPFLVQHRPSSLDDMYDLGFIPPTVPIEHLNEARELAKRVSLPGLMDVGQGQWVSDHAIPGVNTVPRRAAIAQEVIRRTSIHLERVGHSPMLASVVANRVVEIISPAGDGYLQINTVKVGDLDVRGTLYVTRQIFGLEAMDVTFHWDGWIVPQGSHFLLTCNKVSGLNDAPHLSAHADQIVQDISAAVPKPGPIEGWTNRLPVNEIHERAMQVTQNWR